MSLPKLLDTFENHTSATQDDYDTLLAKCVAADEWDSVLKVLEWMKDSGLQQESSTFVACLEACAREGNRDSAVEMLVAMEPAGFPPNATHVSMVIQTLLKYPQERRWTDQVAHLIGLRQSNKKNHGHPRDSMVLEMSLYEQILRSFARFQMWRESLQLLRMMERIQASKPRGSVSGDAYQSVILCCCKAGNVDQALQILQTASRAGHDPTVSDMERILQALSRKGQWRRALQLLQEVPCEDGASKTVACYNSVLMACAKAKEVTRAKHLLWQMQHQDGLAPDVRSYNAVLSACANMGRWKDAASILDQCHRNPQVTPDIFTYTNAIRANAKGGQARRALSLFQVVKDKQLPLDAYCYTAAIESCAKASMWKRALELLQEMQDAGISPTEVTYGVTITALGNGGEWKQALDLLGVMRQKNMTIHLIAYNSAITALAKAAKKASKSAFRYTKHGNDTLPENDETSQLWKKSLDLLDEISNNGLEPDGFSYCAAISCCGVQGRWKEALDLIDTMQKGGPRLRPNKIAYTAAITSCGRSGKVDEALQLFTQMKEQGLSADRVAYNALYLAVRVAQKADVAVELWNEMTQRDKPVKHLPTRHAAAGDRSSTPDIITVTEAIGAMSASPDIEAQYRESIDRIFREAVDRGIVLPSTDTLDSATEVDLSGMTLPVARVACRYIIQRHMSCAPQDDQENAKDLTLITGVGAHHHHWKSRMSSAAKNADEHHMSLREFVQTLLKTEFAVPLESHIPRMAQGTVVIEASSLQSLRAKMAKPQ